MKSAMSKAMPPEAQLASDLTFEGEAYRISLFNSIDHISDIWSEFIPADQVFMQSRYLKIVERVPPEGMRFWYALVHLSDQLVGCIYFQVIHYNAYKSLNLDNEKARNRNQWATNIVHASKEYVAKSIDFDGLIMGNLLVTGQNAFSFISDISLVKQIALADAILHETRVQLINNGTKAKIAFIKDFPDDYFGEKFLEKGHCEEYYRLDAYPNMILELDKGWKSFGEYMNALRSKYRVSVKKAMKSIRSIEKREILPEELEQFDDTMYRLYRNISDTASFNLFFLHPNYFTEFGKGLSDMVTIYGYFLNDQLVAFYSVMDNGSELDAHFLGYEIDLNKNMQLYKNMLLDMIELAIMKQSHRIVFSRTAMEIKSSIGATDFDMSCYIQHKNKLQNVLYAKFFDWLKPENSWVIRQPFRDVD